MERLDRLNLDCALVPSFDGLSIYSATDVTNGVKIEVTENDKTSTIALSENDAIELTNWLFKKYAEMR